LRCGLVCGASQHDSAKGFNFSVPHDKLSY
jgi:hypothetical protein